MGTGFTANASSVLVSVLLCCFIFVTQSVTLNSTSLGELVSNLKGEGSSSWNTSGTDPCKWERVTCINGNVTDLSLSSLDLNGSIAPDIGLLQSLVNLDLSNNSLTGSIPAELSDCTALSTVNLSLNKISGEIPKSLGKLQKLQVLDLSQNRLDGAMPQELGNLKFLQKLNLESNNLSGSIIQDFSNLTSLTDLSLSRNNFSGSLPSSIGELPHLESFSAYQNNFQGEIPFMKALTLKIVNLASNSLSGPIPANMCASGDLSVLTLTSNALTGSIPEDLGSCRSLSTLRLGNNHFRGKIPNSLGRLENLVYFVADHNQLTGEIPSNISALKNLSLLSLANNTLTGGIPMQWSQDSMLQELVLSNNFFSGEIPQELVQCKNLSSLVLSMNNLTGSLPANICTLSSLTSLILDSNSLSGAIPASIGNCSRLLELQLGYNHFDGSIPPQIGNLDNLQISLNLSFNELTGPIPDTLANLQKLVSLDLSHNHLSGPIPEELSHMNSLLEWNFSYNNLSGPVPMTGPIANFSAGSYANNPGLCGGPLPPCVDASLSPKGKHNSHTFWKAMGISIACALVVLLIVSGIVIGVMHRHDFTTAVDPTSPATVRRHFSQDVEQAIDFESIKEATSRNANIISTNHFSTIYKAVMPSGLVLAAKKLNSTEKGLVIYQRKTILELDKMLRLSHENIMQPMGYFLENDLAIIMYDFVPSFSLSQKLHRNFESVLPWSSRYKIALAAAQGLTFLHHYCTPPMMHMDVSSSNIFLGPNFEVKIGDVEVAKLLDPTKHTGSISAVAGSFGYIAPEYAFTMCVTLASNVYSFGVVLLELLTGRRPVDESFGDGLDLVRWVHGASLRGEMPEQILDARISAQSFASRQEMLSVLKVAVSCTNAAPLKRPRMKKILEALQEAKSPTEVLSPIIS